ncbi:MAG: beta-ketoacyl synthase chain length factor [Undibacterium sp.]|nr:beta-ketoacyl synthase chain length factor [Undibacterium sp.]
MHNQSVKFSISKHTQWAPGLVSDLDWEAWLLSTNPLIKVDDTPPKVAAMPALLRRRARFLGRMALEVAYACLGDARDVPTIFCSRHGDVALSLELISELLLHDAAVDPNVESAGGSISPIGFSSAVHNATAGLFSIARQDHANHLALAAGASSVEHAVIEACSLLADGASEVLLVVAEQKLPPLFQRFEDSDEQPYAFAWLIKAANSSDSLCLHWEALEPGASPITDDSENKLLPAGLAILRFQLGRQRYLTRHCATRRWTWSRHV